MPSLDQLREWVVSGGFKSGSPEMLQRPSAKSYPNTFVMMWKNVNVGGEEVPHVCLDLHYFGSSIKSGQLLQALGGMWAKGVDGALKPQQDDEMRKKLLEVVPSVSPSPTLLGKFGKY